MRGFQVLGAFVGLLSFNTVFAAPMQPVTSLTSRAAGAAAGPWFAVYTDQGTEPAPAVDKIKGFNVVIMSFILSSGAADMALAWQNMPEDQRTTVKKQYQAAGIKLLVSAFGSTEGPTTAGKDPKTLASTMAAWVKKYGVDGIDVDYEDTTAMNKADGKAEQWLIDFTNALRAELPQGQFLLTHAPMAPWMGTSSLWKGAYGAVNKAVGKSIDWYNVQFYNQGPSEYTTCDGLITKSSINNPGSSLFEMKSNGFELNKLVIGKPGAPELASTGQMDATTLAGCVSQAKAKGWNAGVMSWEWPQANSEWITTVRGTAFPVGASSGAAPSVKAATPAKAAVSAKVTAKASTKAPASTTPAQPTPSGL